MKSPLLLLTAAFALLTGGTGLAATPVDEIRAAEKALSAALTSPDPTAWVYHYTEDAVFVGPGSPPVSGRAELLAMAKAMGPLVSVVITPLHTELSGNLAAVLIAGTWTSAPKSGSPRTTHARNLIVWRKEADGKWRIALELYHEAEPAK